MVSKRILQLRNVLGISQAEFGRRIGMNPNAVLNWEKGTKSIKESSILLIIRTFNVNPLWLRAGKGEMFLPTLAEEFEPIVDWMKTLTGNKKPWFCVEMERKFPEYKEWLKDRK